MVAIRTHRCSNLRSAWGQPPTEAKHDPTRNTRSRQLLHTDTVRKTDVPTERLELVVVVALCRQFLNNSTDV